MHNIKELKEYLIDSEEAYLKNPISSKKVIMLSGKWGSGKTHFWTNVEKNLDKSIYISLYGKQSIKDIQNEVLTKAFLLQDNTIDEKAMNTISSFYSITKNIADLIVPKSSEKIDYLKDSITKNLSSELVDEKLVICFDDFERKSKHIDLNELFGFINQLTLNTSCKTIIILNSEIFKGDEKKVFIDVKEKTISKFLYFEPLIGELFDELFDYKYNELQSNKKVLKDIFEEVNIINARIILQVLENIKEWLIKNEHLVGDGNILKYFVLVNVNFILNHHTFISEIEKEGLNPTFEVNLGAVKYSSFEDKIKINVENENNLNYIEMKKYLLLNQEYNNNLIKNLKYDLPTRDDIIKQADNKYLANINEFIDENEAFVKSLNFLNYYNLEKYLASHNTAELNILNNINQFIKTGICKRIK